jgi:hypothetical protein
MRYGLSDSEWSVIRPMLPNKPRGVPRVDDRRVLDGIYSGSYDRVRRGAICQRAAARTQLATIASSVGGGLASGTESWMLSPLHMTRQCR